MSGIADIGGFGGSGPNLAQLLQQLKAESGGGGPNAAGRSGRPSDSHRAAFESRLEASAEAAGLDDEAVVDLKEKIQQAVVAAFEDQDAAGNPSDRRQAIRDAVRSTLEENGLDPDVFFEAAMAPPKAGSMFTHLGKLADGNNDISSLLERLSSVNILA